MQITRSPVDGAVYVERPHATPEEREDALALAAAAQQAWRETSLEKRCRILAASLPYFEEHKEDIAAEITRQMGRPIRYTAGELGGLAERAEHMINIAPEALADVEVGEKEGFKRFIPR